MVALVFGLALLQPEPLDFFRYGPYDGGVPKPDALLGYGPGERHTTYHDQDRVVRAIADGEKGRLKVIEYGKSTEGRPLRIVVCASPENLKRLDAIRSDAAKLANPVDGVDTAAIQKRMPAIVWINECIHGSETASFESAMWLLYNLGASRHPDIEGMLKDTVVIVNPAYNPDGHERHVVWYNSVATGSDDPNAFERRSPGIVYGRVNKYRFDMNRDRVAMSQDETRAEVAEFLRWNPQVYVDQHGQTSNYFFPPNPMAVNVNIGRNRLDKWTHLFGREIGKAFDAQGWLYFVKEEFDMYYAGYLDSWATLSGAIGMTYETDGGAFLRVRRDDGSLLTLRDGVEKHFVSAITTARAASAHRADLLRSFTDFKRSAVTGAHAGKFQRVVATADDPRTLVDLQTHLARHGVAATFAAKGFDLADAHDYWSDKTGSVPIPPNSLVIDMAQAQGPVAKAMLEPGSDFEPEFVKRQKERRKGVPEGEEYPGPDGSEFYDATGWSLIYAYGVRAWWSEHRPSFEAGPIPKAEVPRPPKAKVGWALRYSDEADILAIAEAMRQGVRVHQADRPLKVEGKTYAAGTFLVLKARQEDDPLERLAEIGRRFGVSFEAINGGFPDSDRYGPGSASNRPLKNPRIAVVFGSDSNPTDFGSLWYLMDRRFKLPFTPIRSSALEGDLTAYSAIVFPSGYSGRASDNLKRWMRAGGCAVVLGEPKWALGSDGLVSLEPKKLDGDVDDLPGSLFRAELDARSFLAYGYPVRDGKVELAIQVSGSTFFAPRKEGGSVLRVPSSGTNLLSGWAWDETEKQVAGTVWAHEQPFGQGRVVVFADDPTFRAMWNGQWKMLLNAMLLGPSP
ncbi:MAG: hypothetical protein KIS66_09700 [Fimbriimonadaceae bacterium]|nr:hypothetical protein [Fimbriimonadaceae bacterium]